MRTEFLDKGEFRERFGDELGHTALEKGEEPVVYLPYGASTRVRLHEIYHATESPHVERIQTERGTRWYSEDELAGDEVRASKYSLQMASQRGDMPWGMFQSICGQMIDRGYKPATVMAAFTRALNKEGYEPLSREERSDLWWDIREMYDEKHRR